MDKKEIELLKTKSLVQHNALTMARYEMTTSEKDILYMLLAQLDKDDLADKIYWISIKDIENLTNKELSYEQVRKSTIKLISRVYTIIEGEDILHVSIISSARHIKGTGKVAIRIDPEVRPYLFDLKKNFTKYGLFMALSLQSKYSRRLYEMLSQFKHTGVMRITVEELKYRLHLKDPKSGKDKYSIWTTFVKKVLEVAKKELKEYTDISFTYEGKKQGRKFTDLEFKISYKESELTLEGETEEAKSDTEIYKRLTEKFKLSSWQAKIILNQLHINDINSTLYDIQLKKINNGIKNIGGFTAHTFDNKYKLGLISKNELIKTVEHK